MQVVLLRVGIDTGSGGILGPLFSDGSFEYIPIPDCFAGRGVDTSLKLAASDCRIDPSTSILSLRHLRTGIRRLRRRHCVGSTKAAYWCFTRASRAGTSIARQLCISSGTLKWRGQVSLLPLAKWNWLSYSGRTSMLCMAMFSRTRRIVWFS